MNQQVQDIQDSILLKALEDVAFDGWSWELVEAAAIKAGHKADMAAAVFPEKLDDVVMHFSIWIDRMMGQILEKELQKSNLRVRDKIAMGVHIRFDIIKPYRDAVQPTIAYWARISKKVKGAKLVWNTADKIWVMAGDTATDYNHYTKRILLSSILTSSLLYWLNDQSVNSQDTKNFVDRRINTVLTIGKTTAKLSGFISDRFKKV